MSQVSLGISGPVNSVTAKWVRGLDRPRRGAGSALGSGRAERHGGLRPSGRRAPSASPIRWEPWGFRGRGLSHLASRGVVVGRAAAPGGRDNGCYYDYAFYGRSGGERPPWAQTLYYYYDLDGKVVATDVLPFRR